MHLEPIYFELGHGYKNEEVIKGPWTLSNKYFEVKDDHRLSTHEAIFSHNKFHFVLKHDFIDSLQKIILPIGAVILFSSFINFFASLKFGPNADWRIGGQLTLILTIFALKFSIADQIPVTHYLNFIDELFLIAIIVVGLNLLSGVFINNMYQQKPTGPRRLQKSQLNITTNNYIRFTWLGYLLNCTMGRCGCRSLNYRGFYIYFSLLKFFYPEGSLLPASLDASTPRAGNCGAIYKIVGMPPAPTSPTPLSLDHVTKRFYPVNFIHLALRFVAFNHSIYLHI